MDKILILNGPNLNLLGQREPAIYGSETLGAIEARLTQQAQSQGVLVSFFQSNSEGALIDRIQQAAAEGVQAIIINPGGLSHTSVSLRDAFVAVAIPFVEIHLSNIYARENFRHHSYLSAVARGIICGCGPQGYEMALTFAVRLLKEKK